MEKYNYKELNEEFQTLLKKHENDTKFESSADKKIWKEFYPENEHEILLTETACICNAWIELCSNHKGLREVADWVFGASDFGYDNPWDVYVGDKNVVYG